MRLGGLFFRKRILGIAYERLPGHGSGRIQKQSRISRLLSQSVHGHCLCSDAQKSGLEYSSEMSVVFVLLSAGP